MIKNLLKTSAALATLIVGSQTWGATVSLGSLAADGTLATAIHYPHTGSNSLVATTDASLSIPPFVVEDGAVVRLSGTALVMENGGIVSLGSSLTIDIAITAWTMASLIATKDLDIYLRGTTKGTNIGAFTISNLVLAGSAKTIKVWLSDVTAPSVTAVKVEAKSTRNAEPLTTTVDLPSPVPTKKLGGRDFTLSTIYSKSL